MYAYRPALAVCAELTHPGAALNCAFSPSDDHSLNSKAVFWLHFDL